MKKVYPCSAAGTRYVARCRSSASHAAAPLRECLEPDVAVRPHQHAAAGRHAGAGQKRRLDAELHAPGPVAAQLRQWLGAVDGAEDGQAVGSVAKQRPVGIALARARPRAGGPESSRSHALSSSARASFGNASASRREMSS